MKRSYQRDCHAIQTFELGYSCRRSEEVTGAGVEDAVTLHILCINCCLNTHTHTLLRFVDSGCAGSLLRSASVREMFYAKMGWADELQPQAQLANGNRQATSCSSFYNWPGQKVNFLCSSCVVLLLISYVCYCCFCSSRVASWANGLLLVTHTRTHTHSGSTFHTQSVPQKM